MKKCICRFILVHSQIIVAQETPNNKSASIESDRTPFVLSFLYLKRNFVLNVCSVDKQKKRLF